MAMSSFESSHGDDAEAENHQSSDSNLRFSGERSIQIARDVLKSTIISGDGNTIIVVHYQDSREETASVLQIPPKEIDADLTSNPYKEILNPYQPLDAFQVEDSERFFGREKQIKRLWKKFRQLKEESAAGKSVHRLLAVLGSSGSGKSSLVRAGCIPELVRSPLSGWGRLQVSIMKPNSCPLESLALALARMETGKQSPMKKQEEFEEIMKRSNEGLRKIAQALPQTEGSGLVLVVDQFEETFSLCKDTTEQTAFIENLLTAALDPGGTVSVLLCLRNDFLDATYNYSTLNQVIVNDKNHLIVPVMIPDELRLAIQCPAEWAIKKNPAMRTVQPLDLSTVNWLIEQAEDREGVLPLLQFALSDIWEGLQNGKEPAKILQEIGGVGGALKDKADEIFESLESSEQEIARRIFLGLVQLGEGTKETRRRVEISKLVSFQDDPKLVRQVINRFCNPSARLITLSSSGSAEQKVVTAEVTHEALFEHWPLLKKWINNQRDALPEQRKIEASVEQWKKNTRKKGYLLEGQLLKDAERYQKEKAMDLPLSAEATEFIGQSRKKKRNDRLRFYSIFLIPFIVFTLVGGIDIYKRILANRVNSLLEKQKEDQKNNRDIDPKENTVLLSSLEDLVLFRYRLSAFKLQGAILNNAPLKNSDLSTALLQETKLIRADLRAANLSNVNLTTADLTTANLTSAILNEVYADYRVKFYDARLENAKVRASRLNNADFREANLLNADFTGSDFTGSDFTGSNFKGAVLSGTNLRGANLGEVENLTSSQLNQAILCQTTLSPQLKVNSNRDCNKSIKHQK
jgi:uncharacterized protein YjbI with pentapeptide repeats